MKFIIGYKKEMTQQYREDGSVVPVTVVKADPAVITQVKSQEKDGYQAIQVGLGTKNKAGKSQAGHLKQVLDSGRKPFMNIKEFRVEDASTFNVGDTIGVNTFSAGDVVAVTGVSKGKGFQGVVKRHGFAGSPASHGHKDQLRMPGSIGSQDPQHVFKGTRMGGRMGGNQITVKNLEVVSVDEENNLLFVKGALPGSRNSLVVIAGKGDLILGANLFAAPAKEEPSVIKEGKVEEGVEEKQEESAPKEVVEPAVEEKKEDQKEAAKPESAEEEVK